MTQAMMVRIILYFFIFPFTSILGANILLSSIEVTTIPYGFMTWLGAFLVTRALQGVDGGNTK